MRRKTARSCVLVAIVLASHVAMSAASARADAIEGPPACPPGARGQSSHAGQWCVAWPCTSDAECEGASCRPWRVCTRASMVPPGGHGGFDRPPTRQELVVGTCDPARACTGTEEPPPDFAGTFEPGAPACQEASFCVPAGLPPLPPRDVAPGRDAPPPVPGTTVAPSTTAGPTSGPVTTPGASCACSAGAGRPALSIALATLALALVAARRR